MTQTNGKIYHAHALGELILLKVPWSSRQSKDSVLSPSRYQWHLPQNSVQFQFSPSVVSDSLWPHGLQHARLSCPSPTPGVYSNSCPLSRWCHPIISSSVVPSSSCLQSFPIPRSFPMCQFFTSGGQSIGVSASASVLPMNIQDWFPLGWTGWISLLSMFMRTPWTGPQN